MVIIVGKAIENDFDFILNEVKAVKDSLKILESEVSKKIILKVILETCFLSDFQIVECCKASVSGGADFVKTSTGFASPKSSEGQLLPNGASVHHVQLMRKTVGEKIGVKASGGIRSYNTLIQISAYCISFKFIAFFSQTFFTRFSVERGDFFNSFKMQLSVERIAIWFISTVSEIEEVISP